MTSLAPGSFPSVPVPAAPMAVPGSSVSPAPRVAPAAVPVVLPVPDHRRPLPRPSAPPAPLPPQSRLDPGLLDLAGPRLCLRLGILPLYRAGGSVLLAVSIPVPAADMQRLTQRLGPVITCPADREEIQDRILSCRRHHLVQTAETGLSPMHSCRHLSGVGRGRAMSGGALVATGLVLASPTQLFTWLFLLAAAVLGLNTLLKLVAGLWGRRRGRHASCPSVPATLPPITHPPVTHPPITHPAITYPPVTLASPPGPVVDARHNVQSGVPAPPPPAAPAQVVQTQLPVVSILVPLLREERVAGALLDRLGRLDYPDEQLDICLIVEERDRITRRCLEQTPLPPRFRVIVVPHGPMRTKPRALNYALPLCRGEIVGIYDAEDAPDPDQIRKVVQHFFNASPRVACVQCVLDYYNATTNWLSRCFTIEYATWFRVVLPGFEGLGLPIPLGGTSVFLRRDVLEELGGWDAFNVTEDADLGMRLARFGYRTELVDSVTREEANCRAMPWVRQRSRWLKGYAMTYMVHMRRPLRLFRDLGLKRFAALQVLFLGTLLGFTLAPVVLSFWLMSFGLLHPAALHLSPGAIQMFQAGFLLAEVAAMAVALLAVSRRASQGLGPWILTMHVYFPLASLAVAKAAVELLFLPFYWDKTAHGTDPERANVSPGSA